jgi:hypothetical protein
MKHSNKTADLLRMHRCRQLKSMQGKSQRSGGAKASAAASGVNFSALRIAFDSRDLYVAQDLNSATPNAVRAAAAAAAEGGRKLLNDGVDGRKPVKDNTVPPW